jgi:PAS domain S-box-containing protein
VSPAAEEPVHILLVEDEEAHAELTRRAFEGHARTVELTRARSLREAREKIAARLPHLVVADLRLPDGDGAELLSGDRESARYPVVIMTSHGDEQVAVDAMRTGALDYVVKSEVTLAGMPYIAERALREWGHISERRRAEEALRASEEHFRLLIENALDMISILAADGTVGYISPSCKRVLGYLPGEVVGRNVLDLVHPEDRDLVEEALAESFAGPGAAHSYVARMRASGGGWRLLESIGSVRADPQEGLRAVVNSRDITDRREAEEEKERLEAQLRHARKMETLGTLAGGIAHDFNNILQAIVGCTELAQHTLPDESAASGYLQRVVDATGRARNLVRQILTFSRQSEPERRQVSIEQVVEEALALLRATLPTTIEIRRDFRAGGHVLADPTQLQQVLMNLCTNAQHAMEPNGGVLEVGLHRVELEEGQTRIDPNLERPGPFVMLSVKDDGCGMSEETRERIFEPFFSTKEVGKGTGLGLSVAHGIVASHGGAIRVESRPGGGTTFQVYLPEADGARRGDARRVAAVDGRRWRILYVDDEETLLLAGQGLLERLGHDVTVTTDGLAALEAFRARPDGFDVVITDQTMPRLTGVQLARQIHGLRPDIPVVITTGYSEALDPDAVAELGVAAYLAKPFAARDLLRTVQQLLGEREPRNA